MREIFSGALGRVVECLLWHLPTCRPPIWSPGPSHGVSPTSGLWVSLGQWSSFATVGHHPTSQFQARLRALVHVIAFRLLRNRSARIWEVYYRVANWSLRTTVKGGTI